MLGFLIFLVILTFVFLIIWGYDANVKYLDSRRLPREMRGHSADTLADLYTLAQLKKVYHTYPNNYHMKAPSVLREAIQLREASDALDNVIVTPPPLPYCGECGMRVDLCCNKLSHKPHAFKRV